MNVIILYNNVLVGNLLRQHDVDTQNVLCHTGFMLDKSQKHLDSVHESYARHLCFAVCFGVRMIGGGLAAIIHGLCPAVFDRTGSNTLFKLYDEMKARQANQFSPPNE